ncbi:hypothetical protein M1437_04565 [Patescibacteria group bacterium]|nr:hypothetical protein [Patescibacteria group bacterium]
MKLKSTILIFAILTTLALFLGANKTLACSSEADCPQGQSCSITCTPSGGCTSGCIGGSICTDSTCNPTGPFQCYTCAAQGFCSAFTSTTGCASDCSGCSGGGGGGGGGTCYSSTAITDSYTTSNNLCTVTITHLGWDYSDNSTVYYVNSTDGTGYRTVNMNDSDTTCKPQINLQFTNDWRASTDQLFYITNSINSKNAGHDLGSGWQLDSTGCTIGDCTAVRQGPSGRTYNSGSDTWYATLNYCGNGVCSCGETPATCLADCALTPPTVIPPALCPTPGNSATVSWNATTDAFYYQVRVSPSNHTTPPNCSSLNTGEYCFDGITATSYTFPSIPGAAYSWWVSGCDTFNGTRICSSPTKGDDFTCALPPCPGGIIGGVNTLAACGGAPQPPSNTPPANTISYCNKTWIPDPGPGNAYNLWCAANANPTRGYCYQCAFTPAPTLNPAWIQINGDVHSNTGINAPGGP